MGLSGTSMKPAMLDSAGRSSSVQCCLITAMPAAPPIITNTRIRAARFTPGPEQWRGVEWKAQQLRLVRREREHFAFPRWLVLVHGVRGHFRRTRCRHVLPDH